MSKDRYIWLDGEKIFVTEEVYRAYYRPVWREIKQKEVRDEKECALEALEDNGFEVASHEALIDEIVADKLLLDELYAALAELTDDERSVIDALFYDEKTEREFASMANVTQQTVHKKKNRILAKLKRLMNLGK